jgi:hypothetical protein
MSTALHRSHGARAVRWAERHASAHGNEPLSIFVSSAHRRPSTVLRALAPTVAALVAAAAIAVYWLDRGVVGVGLLLCALGAAAILVMALVVAGPGRR